MDSGQQDDPELVERYVNECLHIIKTKMPETYKSVQAKAKEIGKEAYALVRRGLRGEPNCFYATEAGWVVGTAFNLPDITPELAVLIVQFGSSHMVLWAAPAVPVQPSTEGARHGTD